MSGKSLPEMKWRSLTENEIASYMGVLADARTVLTDEQFRHTQAARDVLAERARQKAVEGWTPEHDDAHVNGQMALAAACYAANSMLRPDQNELDRYREAELRRRFWPWNASWWKPKDPRRDLVRAGALILAEIERLDRKAGAEQ